MPLFHVQDDERPMWVVAPNWGEALNKWAAKIGAENECEDSGLYLAENPPRGIALICEDDELLP